MKYTRQQLDAALQHLFGSSSLLEDKAKHAVARAILDGAFGPEHRDHLLITEAGVPVKAALGDAWGTSQQRTSQGKPGLTKVLADDPYFSVKENRYGSTCVHLKLKALSMFIPDEDPEAGGSHDLPIRPGAENCPFFMKHGWCEFKDVCRYTHPPSAAAPSPQPVLLRDGLHPIRPGVRDCKWWTTTGYCQYKQKCMFNHPLLTNNPKGPGKQRESDQGLGSSRSPPLGVEGSKGLPIRQGVRVCPYLARTGRCTFGMKCWFNHPEPQDRSSSSQGNGTHSNGSNRATAGLNLARVGSGPDEAPQLVFQPPANMLLDWVVDGLWPPEGGKDSYVKGALAKWIISNCFDPDRLVEGGQEYSVLTSKAGLYLKKHWAEQSRYESSGRPYVSFNALLEGDPYLESVTPTAEEQGQRIGPTLKLHMSKMLEGGSAAALKRLSRMAAAVWRPDQDQESWARFTLAQLLMREGLKPQMLMHTLAMAGEEAEEPTGFRLDMATASQMVRGRWQDGKHGYTMNSKSPWGSSFKSLFQDQPFFSVEQDPWKDPTSPSTNGAWQIAFDVADLYEQWPWLQQGKGPAIAKLKAAAAAADGAGGASSSARGRGVAQPQRLQSPGEWLEVEQDGGDSGSDDDALEQALQEVLGASPAAVAAAAAAAAVPVATAAGGGGKSGRASSSGSGGGRPRSGSSSSGAPGGSNSVGGGGDMRGSASSSGAGGGSGGGASGAAGGGGGSTGGGRDGPGGSSSFGTTAINAASSEEESWEVYQPPSLEWWWPEDRKLPPHATWVEIATKVVDPNEDPLALAEVAQHLELTSVLGVACATYKSHPHLLQLFLPHASVGDLVMPATVYLLDTMQPGQVREVMGVIKPVLESKHVLKVVHSSKQWSFQIQKNFGIKLQGYLDTQQMNYVLQSIRAELGKFKSPTEPALKQTAEVSLNSLMHKFGYYHPIRHDDASTTRIWQSRPLSEDLIECAAADVAYLIPLMEELVTVITSESNQLGSQLAAAFRGSGPRSNALLGWLPFESSMVDVLARGVGQGQRKVERLLDWANASEAFHQLPFKDMWPDRLGGGRY